MGTISREELKIILDKHNDYLHRSCGEQANLRAADLRFADLGSADLRAADLRYANLCSANLRYADLRSADLGSAALRAANLRSADLGSADLRSADLSGCKGLLDPIEWMARHLKKNRHGYLAYKSFNSRFPPPDYWVIKEGEEISEVVNPLPTLDCACGVNVSTRGWGDLRGDIWEVLIRWVWLPSVVVPYNTSGKFRCGRVKLLGRVTK